MTDRKFGSRITYLLCYFMFLSFVTLIIKPSAVAAANVTYELMYVANITSDEVRAYDLVSDTYFPELSINDPGLVDPAGMALGPDNLLYISSRGTNEIRRYDLAGEFVDVFACGCTLDAPNGILFTEFDPGTGFIDVILIANQGGNTISMYDLAGNFLLEYTDPGMDGPSDMIGIGDTLFVTSSGGNAVYTYDADTGAYTGFFNGGGLADPLDIFEFGGDLYVSSQGDNTIKRYDIAGNLISNNIIDTATCGAIGVNSLFIFGGTLYVSDEIGNKIQEYDPATGDCVDPDVTLLADTTAGSTLDGPTDVAFFTLTFLDTDNDDVIDVLDACPSEPGTIANNGCPEATPPPGGNSNPPTSISISVTVDIEFNIGIDFISNLEDPFINVKTSSNTTIQTTIQSTKIEHMTSQGQSAIGNMQVIETGVIYAVDIFTLDPNVVTIAEEVKVCMVGIGSMVYLESLGAPRPVTYLAVAHVYQYTCATITTFGTLVLVNNNNSPIVSGEPYVDMVAKACGCNPNTGSSSTGTTVAPDPVVPLSNCQVTTQYMLNFRSTASLTAQIITTLPYQLQLQAIARTEKWFNVIYKEFNGWVYGEYVTTSGQCNG